MLGTRGPRLSPVHGVRYWVLDARELEALPGMTLRVRSAHVSEGDMSPSVLLLLVRPGKGKRRTHGTTE